MNKKRALHPRQKKVSGEVLLFLSYFSVFRKEDHLRYHPQLQELQAELEGMLQLRHLQELLAEQELQEHLLEETHLAAFRP